MWETRTSRRLQQTHHRAEMSLLAKVVEQMGKDFSERAKPLHSCEREKWGKGERNDAADTKVTKEGGAGGVPCTGAEIPLQPLEKITKKLLSPCNTWMSIVEKIPAQQPWNLLLADLQPVGHQHRSGLFLKDYAPLRRSVLGYHVEGKSVGNDKVK